jgi:hypothetical protein
MCPRVWNNIVVECLGRGVEGDHHLHNVNEFNTLLDILSLGVINFVGLLFSGKEAISTLNCG